MTKKESNVISMEDFNLKEEFKAMKYSLVGMSKQVEITIKTTNEIIEKYNQVVQHQNEISTHIKNLFMDDRLTKNIINQLRGFFEKTFPSYMTDPHFVKIKQLSDLLIDSSETGLQKKKDFFEQAEKAAKANETTQTAKA